MSDELIKSVYILMISLGLTKVEIDKELILKNDDPSLYVTYDNKNKKYVFECEDAGKESDEVDTSGHNDTSAWKYEIDRLLIGKPTNLYLNKDFYNKYEDEINAYLSVRGYQIIMEDYGNIYFEKMIPKRGWVQYE